MTENIKLLVDKLKKKTAAKQAVWVKTSRDNEFRLELNNGAVTIDNWYDDSRNKNLVDLLVYNDNGEVIDRVVYSTEKPEEHSVLLELHSLAKMRYYKVDETFKDIFEELDSDKIIGTPQEDEDLPF